MGRGKIQRLEVTMDELEAIVERAQLSDDDREKLQAALETLALLTNELETKGASIRRLRKLLFGSSSEKLDEVLRQISASEEAPAPEVDAGAARSGEERSDFLGTGRFPDLRIHRLRRPSLQKEVAARKERAMAGSSPITVAWAVGASHPIPFYPLEGTRACPSSCRWGV